MWRTTLKSIGAHKRRLLATCSAVVLGVAFLSGTLVLGDTMRSGFGDMFSAANAGTDAIVRSRTEVGSNDISERGLLGADVVDKVAAVRGVAAAVPEIYGIGQIVGADGDAIGGNGPPTQAGNWITNPDINPWKIADGRPPEAPGEVVIDKASADKGHLAVGDRTTIRTPQPVDVTVVGIARFGSAESAGPSTYAAFTTDYARRVLLPESAAAAGQVSDVLVHAEAGVSQTALVDRLEPVIPHGAEALTGAQLTDEQQQNLESDFLGFFEAFLLVFAGIALVVATFSIYNTFSILVAQRTRDSALLRALGASRRQVLTSTIVEALVVGVLAAAIGVAVGIGLASGLNALSQSAGFSVASTALLVEPSSLVIAALVGVVVTLIASVAPAIRSSRVAPLAALRDVAVDRSGGSFVRGVVGLLIAAAGAIATIAGTSGDGSLPLTGAGALFVVVGVVLLGPVVARPVAGTIGGPLALRRGLSGTLARRNAMRNPRRTAGTASALMVGVAVVTLFTVVASSLKASINDTVDQQFAGDLVIAQSDFSGAGISPELTPAVARLPQVAVATGVANAPIAIDGKDYAATAVDPREFGRVLDLTASQGSLDRLGDRQVALYKDYAKDHGLNLGDTVPVSFADGATDKLTVGAIYDKDQLVGNVVLPKAAWEPHSAARASDVVLLVKLADGVTTAQGEAAIQPVADRYGAPDVQDRAEYVDSVGSQVDQMLTVIYVLLVMAIIIALMGIANTLSLSIHERTRELGLLRAVGQTRRQLRSMVRGEALVVALFGTVGGLGLGTFLGWAMVKAIEASQGLGSFAVPTGQLAVVVAIGALVGVVAAVRPARRAAKLDVLRAIATD
jgi:putative ABC transport system permease protein